MTSSDIYAIMPSQFIREIVAICDEHPDWKNPYNESEGSCVYEDSRGHHCLIGQWMVNHDIPVVTQDYPDDHERVIEGNAYDVLGFLPNIAWLAERVQNKADQRIDSEGEPNDPPKWRDVGNLIDHTNWVDIAEANGHHWE